MVEWWDEIGQCIICLKTMNINKNGWCDATVFLCVKLQYIIFYECIEWYVIILQISSL